MCVLGVGVCVCVCGGGGGQAKRGLKRVLDFFSKSHPPPTHPPIKLNGRSLMRDRQINSRERGTPVFQPLARVFFILHYRSVSLLKGTVRYEGTLTKAPSRVRD